VISSHESARQVERGLATSSLGGHAAPTPLRANGRERGSRVAPPPHCWVGMLCPPSPRRPAQLARKGANRQQAVTTPPRHWAGSVPAPLRVNGYERGPRYLVCLPSPFSSFSSSSLTRPPRSCPCGLFGCDVASEGGWGGVRAVFEVGLLGLTSCGDVAC
jgi:hypothetical protein